MRLSLAALAFVLAAPLVSAQNAGLQPTYETISLRAGFTPDPHETELTAGGGTPVSISGCTGTVAQKPDIDLHWKGSGSTLYIYAISSVDTTLLVNLPDGSWRCDDDSFEDGDPLVIIRDAPSGLYDIWAGTYGEDTASATVYISEIDPR